GVDPSVHLLTGNGDNFPHRLSNSPDGSRPCQTRPVALFCLVKKEGFAGGKLPGQLVTAFGKVDRFIGVRANAFIMGFEVVARHTTAPLHVMLILPIHPRLPLSFLFMSLLFYYSINVLRPN